MNREEIEALVADLSGHATYVTSDGVFQMPNVTARWLTRAAAALTALVGERDGLKAERDTLEAEIVALRADVDDALRQRDDAREALRRPMTMQDVRLAVGEGPLKPADVLSGCNAEMRRRAALGDPS